MRSKGKRRKMMATKYLENAFSLQMLDYSIQHNVAVSPVTIKEVSESDFVSVIGHQDTAAVVSTLLGKVVPCHRASIHLDAGDTLFVAQVVGERLPEGATTLPEGFSLTWLKVTVSYEYPSSEGLFFLFLY